jgi:hypothetical protein
LLAVMLFAKIGIDAAVAHCALSSETARAVRYGSIPE